MKETKERVRWAVAHEHSVRRLAQLAANEVLKETPWEARLVLYPKEAQ